jgi:hypothetical protein
LAFLVSLIKVAHEPQDSYQTNQLGLGVFVVIVDVLRIACLEQAVQGTVGQNQPTQYVDFACAFPEFLSAILK